MKPTDQQKDVPSPKTKGEYWDIYVKLQLIENTNKATLDALQYQNRLLGILASMVQANGRSFEVDPMHLKDLQMLAEEHGVNMIVQESHTANHEKCKTYVYAPLASDDMSRHIHY